MAVFGKKRIRIGQWLRLIVSLMTTTALLSQCFGVFFEILFASALLRIFGIQINCIALHFLASTQCNEFQTSV